jgi:uncharacterized protein YlxW (UPF0749 family)
MSLLVDMMTNTLDAAYEERARSTGAAPAPGLPAPRSGRTRGVLPVVVLVVLGVVTGTAVAQVRERQAQSTGLRADLAAEVRERTAASDDLAARTEALRQEVAQVQEQALGADATGRRVTEGLTTLGLATGTAPVTGPGLVVTLDDAPDDESPTADTLRPGTPASSAVLDTDVQAVVNGVWAAGAEAVAVNGQRLTALTAIRKAGDAILVDLRPLSPPYVIEAIGSPEDLEVDFMDGPTGRGLSFLTSTYGILVDVRRAEDLSLPGAAAPRLSAASPASRPTAAPTPSGSRS